MRRAFLVMLFALTLAAPSLVLAEAAHGESLAHEATAEESGHGAHDDGHGELTFSSLIRNRPDTKSPTCPSRKTITPPSRISSRA